MSHALLYVFPSYSTSIPCTPTFREGDEHSDTTPWPSTDTDTDTDTASQPPPLPLPLLLHLGGDALPQDLPGLHRHLALPLLEDEGHAGGGGRVLLAADMVRLHLRLRLRLHLRGAVLAYSPECNHTCDIVKAALGSKPWITVFHPAHARYPR